MKIDYNHNFDRLNNNYLFSEVRKRVEEYKSNSARRIINLGIGDVIGALSPTIQKALADATNEYSIPETFKGYPPEQGYVFLRQKISCYYQSFGVTISPDDVFISDGAKSDLGNITDVFSTCSVLLPTPVYPVYLDTNIIKGNKINFLEVTKDTNFYPTTNGVKKESYLIYLCSPNNPTGVTYPKEVLQEWINFALETNSIIIYDTAYAGFIRNDYPKSIYSVQGSKRCAIEISSFSKSASFTGLRLGYTIIPKEFSVIKNLKNIWLRRQSTKFNGVSYLIQKAGESALTEIGLNETKKQCDYYLTNAEKLKTLFKNRGLAVYGDNSPYVWVDCKCKSWEFFDKMLSDYQLVGTPGVGFGKGGEGYFRLSAFAKREDIYELYERMA